MTPVLLDKKPLARNTADTQPVTLNDLFNLLTAVNNRLIRIETRMVRSMLADGLDIDGNPLS